MPIKSSIIFFILAALSNSVGAIEKQNCISSSVAAISGIVPGINEKALTKLKKYTAITNTTGEDDGGGYKARTYHYEKFKITIIRGK